MSMPSTRFRITFGGKAFPEYRPTSVVIPTQSEEVAKEWAKRQLEVWKLNPSEIKVEISQVKPPEEKVAENKSVAKKVSKKDKPKPKSKKVGKEDE